MPQTKKDDVRTSILDAAEALFEESGYTQTSMAAIARHAGLSVSNIYVYFPSKIAVVFAIFEPWLEDAMDQMMKRARSKPSPEERIEYILKGLWRDIPQARGNFFNVFIEAISTTDEEHGYKPSMLKMMRNRLSNAISENLSPDRKHSYDVDALAHILVMAFDGFVINAHLSPKARCNAHMIETMRDLIIGD